MRRQVVKFAPRTAGLLLVLFAVLALVAAHERMHAGTPAPRPMAEAVLSGGAPPSLEGETKFDLLFRQHELALP